MNKSTIALGYYISCLLSTCLRADFFAAQVMIHPKTQKTVILLYDVHASLVYEKEPYLPAYEDVQKITASVIREMVHGGINYAKLDEKYLYCSNTYQTLSSNVLLSIIL